MLPDLSEQEKQVLDDVRAGRPASTDPDERTVRAEFLQDLLLEDDATQPTPRIVHLENVVVTGQLDLSHAEIRPVLKFVKCDFEKSPVLEGATLSTLALTGSTMPGLRAHGIRVGADVHLDEKFTSHGEVDFTGSEVSGSMLLQGAVLDAPGEKAFNGRHMRVAGQMNFHGVEVAGTVDLVGARVEGTLSFWDARLRQAGRGISINAERLRVGETLFAKGSFTSEAAIVLRYAAIGGGMDFAGASLGRGPRLGKSLSASRIFVGRTASFRDANVAGTLELFAAQVGGDLNLHDATLTGNDPRAINLIRARVDRLKLGLKSAPEGTICLRDAEIPSIHDDLSLTGLKFDLQNLTYLRLKSSKAETVENRIAWIERSEGGYLPGPYDALAAFYRAAGQEGEARKVAFAKEKPAHEWST